MHASPRLTESLLCGAGGGQRQGSWGVAVRAPAQIPTLPRVHAATSAAVLAGSQATRAAAAWGRRLTTQHWESSRAPVRL